MKILHVHDRWSALGGADWHLLSLLDSLPAEVDAWGVFGRADGSVEAAFGGRSPLAKDRIRFIKKLDKKAPFASEERVGRELAEVAESIGPDLIHVHNIANPHLLEVLGGLGPAVMSVPDHRFFCPGPGKVRPDGFLCDRVYGRPCLDCIEDRRHFERRRMLVDARSMALFGFRALIVVSNYIKHELTAIGLPSSGIRVIPPFPHGLDFTYTPASRGEDILFAGRLVWAKGIIDLLEAMRIDRSLRVKVAGAGTIEETVMARVREWGLEDRIEFLDWVPHGGMAEAYRRARVLALPSRWSEPFGIVGLEAQALGRPVVAYDVGGVRDWLEDERTGFLVEPGDAAGLAEKLGFLVRHPAEADRLGRQARELTLERFNRERLMGELVELYREVARGGRGRPPQNRPI